MPYAYLACLLDLCGTGRHGPFLCAEMAANRFCGKVVWTAFVKEEVQTRDHIHHRRSPHLLRAAGDDVVSLSPNLVPQFLEVTDDVRRARQALL